MRILFGILLLMTASASQAQQLQPNILLVIADDLGLGPVPGYPIGASKAIMPNISALQASGITFDNVWSNPLCSPTRATILTGKYGFRTGVLNVDENSRIAITETTIHEYLTANTAGAYASAIIGKWHLNGAGNPNPSYPQTVGVPYYAGLIAGAVSDYRQWQFTNNGTQSQSTDYITTKFTDLAIDWVGQQNQPWFLWLAYTAPHVPFHLPPLEMHSQGNLPTDQASINANPLPYFLGMVESLDYQLGRLLASMSPAVRANTIVIFIGDNGTARAVIQPPYASNRGKGTLYQGGINVPMVIAGPSVGRMGQREAALINLSDLFATVGDLAGANVSNVNDSKSFKALLQNAVPGPRDFLYSEIAGVNEIDGWTVRNAEYKLLQVDGVTQFFHLPSDPFENVNLLNFPLSIDAQAAFDAITAQVQQTGLGRMYANGFE